MLSEVPKFLRRLFARNQKPARSRTMRRSATEQLEERQLLAATAIQAFHRSGQTFLTWTEDAAVTGESYHIYRSNAPITTANIGQAQKLTTKWGPLDDQTSVHKYAATGAGVPARFVINDLAAPLGDEKGLFVFTTPQGSSGTWYYAVTQVNAGTESTTLTAGVNSLSTGVTESVATPVPVLTVSVNGGKGRIYTQYMDYANWNPTFQGYAYNYSVALPQNYDPNVAWPLKLMPHAFGERMRLEPVAEWDWPCIEVFPDDSGGAAERYQTWWYGFNADHNYITNGSIPTTGHVENFTEQRLLKTIDEVSALFNVDQTKIHSQGHSMGASGSLSLGMRYANVFSGIYGSEPMTNYASSPLFQDSYTALWGSQASNLPIVNRGKYAGPITKYNGMGVYNWMNHHEQLDNRRGEPMAYLMIGHGKIDDIIDWATQGRPFIAALNASRVGYSAETRGGWDHNWMGFSFEQDAMFSPSIGGLGDWVYPRTLSFPGISYASGSGPNTPANTGTEFYNMTIEWATSWNTFGANIVDTASAYEISLRSVSNQAQTADITPRRTQAFSPSPGSSVTWQNINNSNGAVVQSGTVIVDADGLVTIPGFQIGTGNGNRLILAAAVERPNLTGPAATTNSQTPTITWSALANAESYDVWIQNLSTGQNPSVQANVTTTQFVPATALGIGRHRVWVRARYAGGVISAWSAARDFQITTAPAITTQASPLASSLPLLSWTQVAGATKYDLWITNVTTGVSQFIRQTQLTTNSWQVATNLGVGTYRMWVRGVDASGLAAGWSAMWQFSTAGQAVGLTPKTPGFSLKPTFTWQAVPYAATYDVFVQNKATNATVINTSGITGTTFIPAANMAVAEYQWWVRARSNSGTLGTWSVPLSFNVSGRPTVLTPVGTTTNRRPQFSWTAVQGATKYELWVSFANGSGVAINQTNITSASWTPTTNMATGDYRVWVRAVSSTGTTSAWSAPVDITIAAASPLKTLPDSLLHSTLQTVSETGTRAIPVTVCQVEPAEQTTPETPPESAVPTSPPKDSNCQDPELIDKVMSQAIEWTVA